MRRAYLLCYDIANAKRLRRTHRVAKSYGEPWQFSVFYCILSAIERVRLERDLADIINHSEDQILIIDLGPRDEAARETVTTLGPSLPEAAARVVVI
jgi:CRISPR-associated protein Cas2